MRLGWDSKTLGEIVTFKGGGTPSKRNPNYWGGDIQWISPKDMKSLTVSRSLDTVTQDGIANSSAALVPKNSLLIVVRSGILARTIPVAIAAQDLSVNQDLKVLVPCADVLPHYLLYFLRRSEKRLLDLVTRSATVHRLKTEQLKSLIVPLPSPEEQKRIVAILDEAFAGIDTAIANTEKNLANARAVFDGYLRKVFLEIIEATEEVPLERFVKFIDYRGRTPEKTERGLRLITAKNVRRGYLQRQPEEFVSPGSYDAWMTRGIPCEGDVLFTTEAPLGFVCQLDTSEQVVFAQRIITLQPDRAVLAPAYLKYALMSDPIQRRIHEKATGATASGIKASLLKKIPIPHPKFSRQLAISRNAGELESESKSLETVYQQKLTALKELKQSLLHKAFSGELTAAKLEREVDDAVA